MDGTPALRRAQTMTAAFSRVKAARKKQLSLERVKFAAEELRVMTEEASEWLSQTLDLGWEDDLVARFWESVRTGVPLCQLVSKCFPADAPQRCAVNTKAKPESFFARDNVSNFLASAKVLGVHAIALFESDDVIYRRNEKAVVNTLLSIARLAACNGSGVQPPLLVQYELEIDALEESAAWGEEDLEEEEVEVAAEEEDKEEIAEAHAEEEAAVEEEDDDTSFDKFRWLPYIPKKNDALDAALALAVNVNRIDVRIRRSKKGGAYLVGKPPRVSMRLVRHLLLVRVGGGWQGIVQFLVRKKQADDESASKSANVVGANKGMFKDVGHGKDRKKMLQEAVNDIRGENAALDVKNAYRK